MNENREVRSEILQENTASKVHSNNQQRKNIRGTCQGCGLSWNNGHKCKAVGKVCTKCGEVGHFARICHPNGNDDQLNFGGNKPSGNSAKKPPKSKVSKGLKENRNDSNIRKNAEAKNNKKGFTNEPKDQKTSEKVSSENIMALKDRANTLYKQRKFKLALPLYSKLIELSPTEANHYSNRSACYMMMKQYANGQADARKSVELNPSHINGLTRLLRCSLLLGNFIEAHGALTKLTEVDSQHEMVASHVEKLQYLKMCLEKEQAAFTAKQYEEALTEINNCLVTCTQSVIFMLRKGEYLTLLGKYEEAEIVAGKILSDEPFNSDAKYIIGLCMYHSDVSKAVFYIEQVLDVDPGHTKLVQLHKKAKIMADKKEAGNKAVKARKYEKALKFYKQAMAVDPKNLVMKKKLHYNMALAQHQLGELQKSIMECSKALDIDSKYLKALMRRGQCYLVLKKYKEAVEDLTRVCALDDGKDSRRLLDEAKRLLLVSERDDYQIIGVCSTATLEEIKAAYKQKALLHHPDRHVNTSHDARIEHETKFKDITRAYRNIINKYRNPITTRPFFYHYDPKLHIDAIFTIFAEWLARRYRFFP